MQSMARTVCHRKRKAKGNVSTTRYVTAPIIQQPYQHSSHVGGTLTPTNVISISYGQDEQSYSPFWLQRQCLEYLKLGLQGVSIFISSGDYGVAGSCNSSFVPGFPASCPWITTVGATEIRRNGTLREPEIAASQYLKNDNGEPESSFSSGGGFSNYFSRPKYQQNAVSHYFETANLSLPYFEHGNTSSSGKYNRDGRGFPDVSASKLRHCDYIV